MLAKIIPLVFELLATVCAIAFAWKSGPALRLISLQVILTFLVEITGFLLRTNHHGNIWLYNLYLPVAAYLLLYAAHLFRPARISGLHVWAATSLICLTLSIELITSGISSFVRISFLVDAICITLAYLFVLYGAAIHNPEPLLRQPPFWISIGLIIFYGSQIPYLSLLRIITKNCAAPQLTLLYWIFIVLASLLYFLIAVGFCFSSKTHRYQPTTRI